MEHNNIQIGTLLIETFDDTHVSLKCWIEHELPPGFISTFFEDLKREFLPLDLDADVLDINTDMENEQIPPFLRIKDHRWDRLAVEMWWNGRSARTIAEAVTRKFNRVTAKRVANHLCELRKQYGQDIVPTGSERNKELAKRFNQNP